MARPDSSWWNLLSAVQKELDLRKHLRNSFPTLVALAQGSKNMVPKAAWCKLRQRVPPEVIFDHN
jgi:hypothetical protein